MYEELSMNLPDPDAYLARIHMPVRKPASLDYLNSLIYAHQCHVPFENLSLYDLKEEISLDIPKLYDKIVVRKRGGYCFELNSLFFSLLKSLGFNAFPTMCRIVQGRDFLPPIMHRATLIHIDNQLHFCDVGFGGPMPGFAVPLIDRYEKTAYGQTYSMKQLNPYWWIILCEGKPFMHCTIVPQEPVDFVVMNHFCSGPESIFSKMRWVNIRTATGSKSLMDMKLTISDNGNHIERELPNKEELLQVLKEEFSLTI